MSIVSTYWNKNVTNWKVALHLEAGSQPFFEEVERYRFDKLDYLTGVAGFDDYAGKKVLDVGCGLGSDTQRFAKGGADVTAIDIAPRAIEMVQKNFAWRGLSAEFAVMDGAAMDLPDNTFDYVYCHTVLHFADDPEGIIREIHRVLKPGGKALLMAINRRSWLYFLHRIAGMKIDYMDAPVFHKMDPDQFAAKAAVFKDKELKLFRFPVRTEVHKGWKAVLYNTFFVDLFHALPKRLTAGTGYHMIIFATKQAEA